MKEWLASIVTKLQGEQFRNSTRRAVSFLGVVGLYVAVLAIALVLEAFALFCLWRWYVVPLGLPGVGWCQAVGLALITSLLTYHYYPFQKDHEGGIEDVTMHLFVRPVVTLGLGWLVHFLL